jgi:hypothetical protein
MSKKKLLSENEIRRFQGLAGIPAIGEMHCPSGEREEDELEEGGMHYGEREEDEEVEEGMHDGARHEEEPELPGDEGPEDELEMDVEMDASDEGGDLDLSPDQKEDLAADIVRAVAQELSQALDLEEPIEVETDGGEDLEMDMDMGGDDEELDLDLGDEPAGDLEEPAPEEEPLEEEEGAFAPNHYCVHHGGVRHEGKFQMAEAVGHNWSEKEGRVTHYDMKLENGTVLENVAFEDIQVTNASLAEAHHAHKAKRHADEEEELDESNNDDLVNEVLRRVVARLSNK